MNVYVNAVCIVESDGFHQHEYSFGGHTVVENLHAWMDEHRRNWPGSADHEIRLGQTYRPWHGSPVEAWETLTDVPMPAVTCMVQP